MYYQQTLQITHCSFISILNGTSDFNLSNSMRSKYLKSGERVPAQMPTRSSFCVRVLVLRVHRSNVY